MRRRAGTWSTVTAVLLGSLLYVYDVGLDRPKTWREWAGFAVSTAIAGLLRAGMIRGLTPKKLVALLVLLPLLAGCSVFAKPVDELRLDRGVFAVTYADTRSAYVLLASNVIRACKAGKLDTESCEDLARVHDRMGLLDDQIKRTLLNPKLEVDWQAVAEAVKVVTGLALRVAP